jgi:coatomer protein complex subunit gamma
LTKVLYLLEQGDSLTPTEATDLFFAITKLFQSKDIPLRRMVYLTLKELTGLAESVIIVVASLTKDMNSKIDVYRANAIRVLCKIADHTILSQAERYLKQAIVDKEPAVASAALVSGVHLLSNGLPGQQELVKRWLQEIQDALKSKTGMVQYHALGLIAMLRQNDKLSLSKLVLTMTRAPIRTPYTHCLLIRLAARVMDELSEQPEMKGLYEYLESCLHYKSEMVMFEAARALSGLKNASSKELTPAVSVLQLFLSNTKPTMRFAAVRALSRIAQNHAVAVSVANIDLETLISDTNRSIATLAITTLLKTGNEGSIDRLMKQISNFMGEISDEFKVVVVQAIKQLAVKYPTKHRSLLSFLNNVLRDEGGKEFKRSIVETILAIMNTIPEAKEMALLSLCEFIEDCEYTELSTKVLNVLAKEGPASATPSKFVRYIYNRVVLENAPVRAAAVTALTKFGVQVPSLLPSIMILLRRCQFDGDDEVRDRATTALVLLESPETQPLLTNQPILPPLDNYERALRDYKPSDTPFDITAVSHEVAIPDVVPIKGSKEGGRRPALAVPAAAAVPEAPAADTYAEQIGAIPALAQLGPIFKSSKQVELTESETEYVVSVVKHVLANHVILQFNVTNTLKEQLLQNATVKVDLSQLQGVAPHLIVPIPALPFDTPSSCYVALKVAPGARPTGNIPARLKFQVREVDPNTGEVDEVVSYEDEYQVEDVELATADYVRRSVVTNFAEAWEALGDGGELTETYALSIKTLPDAVKEIVDYLGMQPCDGSDQVPPKKTKHALYLSGTYLSGSKILVRARMMLDPSGTSVGLQLTVRSDNPELSKFITQAI